MQRVDAVMWVLTPERVRFEHRVAGPGPRGVAWAIDAAIQGVIGSLGVVVALAAGVVLGEASIGLWLAGWFAVSWFYGAAFEALWGGRTPGKAVVGLRVVRADGAVLGTSDAVLRNLLRGVDGLPVLYLVGAMVCAVDPWLRRIGDLVAGTVVVVDARGDVAGATALDVPVSDEERHALPAAVSLTRDERGAIEALLRRRDGLGAARVEELAGFLAPAIAARTGIRADTHLRTLELAWARATGRVA